MLKFYEIANATIVTVSVVIDDYTELILGLRLANERRRYLVTTPLIGWVQA